jgi:hypothetical protein
MSPTMKNILIGLVLLTVAYFGYLTFSQSGDMSLDSTSASYTDEMIANAQIFIERRNVLDRVRFDTEIFTNPVFSSYQTFTTPAREDSVGRANPFSRPVPQQATISF